MSKDMLESKSKDLETPSDGKEIDIYSDILTDQDDKITKLNQKVERLSKEKTSFLKNLKIQEEKFDDLKKSYDELLLKYKTLSFNTSALFKTAQAEVNRKDRTIKELRREIDNLVFRKIPANQALERARKNVEKKVQSPLKVNEPADPGPPVDDTGCNNSNYDTKVNADMETELRSSESLTEEQISSSVLLNKKTNLTPPPLLGPVTEYSKRMYQRIHGVRPLQPLQTGSKGKVDSEENITISKESQNPEDNTFSSERTKDNICNQQETQSPRVVTKLQEQVKEFIKLGTNSIKNTVVKKSLIEQKSPNSSKTESSQQNKEPTKVQQLVIYCDINDKNSQDKDSPNKIDLNETITSILKKQREGLYSSNKKPIEILPVLKKLPSLQEKNSSKKNNLTIRESKVCNASSTYSDIDAANENILADEEVNHINRQKKHSLSEKSHPNRLIANLNKRLLNKPVISPVTFGTLVLPDTSKINQNIETLTNTKLKDITILSDGSDEKILIKKDINLNVQSKETNISNMAHHKVKKKNKFITSLFGESPLKTKDVAECREVAVEEENKIDSLKNSSQENSITYPNSPVFPDSSSLDSDDSEDLVIDTTNARSQNTSPQVSKSSETGKDNTDAMSVQHQKKSMLGSPSKKKNYSKLLDNIEIHKDNDKFANLKLVTAESSNVVNSVAEETIYLNKNLALCKLKEINSEQKKNITCNSSQKVSLPDLSECFSLESENQLKVKLKPSVAQVLENNDSPEPKLDVKLSVVNPPIGSDPDLCTDLSVSNEVNSESTEKDDVIDVPSVTRFIPSPLQLTLVSALRHSENSVFNITEDTTGFVSALTRVRDISPIRTPDKKNKQSLTSDSQFKILDINKAQEIGKPFDKICTEKNVSASSVVFQNNATSENKLGSESVQFSSSYLENKAHITTKSAESCSKLIESHSTIINSIELNNPQSGPFSEKSKTTRALHNKAESDNSNSPKLNSLDKCVDHEVSTNIMRTAKLTLNDNNVFKRSRPVRRIIYPSKIKREDLGKCNKEDETDQITTLNSILNTNTILTPVKACNETKEVKKCIPTVPSNSTKSIKDEVNNINLPEVSNKITKTKTKVNTEIENNVEVTDDELVNVKSNQALKFVSISSKSVTISPSNSEKKMFKRSESLRTMPKPLAKINYDTLSKFDDRKKEYRNHSSVKPKVQSNSRKRSNKKLVNEKCSLVTNHVSSNNREEARKDMIIKKKSIDHLESNSSENDSAKEISNVKSDKRKIVSGKPVIFVQTLEKKFKIQAQEIAEKKELEQCPHIAIINKKTRVSSYKRDKNNESLVKEPKDVLSKIEKSSISLANPVNENLSKPLDQNLKQFPSDLGVVNKNKQSIATITPDKKPEHNNDFTKVTKNHCVSTNILSTGPEENLNLKRKVSLQNKIKSVDTKAIPQSKIGCKVLEQSNIENENQAKSNLDVNKSKISLELGDNLVFLGESLQLQITQNNVSNEKQISKPDKSFEKSPRINLSLRNTSNDKHQSNRSQTFALKKMNRSKSSERRRSCSSSSEERAKSNHVRRPDKTSPHSRVRSNSCHQTKRSKRKSRETKGRSKSNYLRRSVSRSPDRRKYYSRHRSSRRRSSESKYGNKSHHNSKRSRSISNESYSRKSEHLARSKHRGPRKRHSSKSYIDRSRSRSPKSNDILIQKNEYSFKQSHSPCFSRKRKSRSTSSENMNHNIKSRRLRESNRNPIIEQNLQSKNHSTTKSTEHTDQNILSSLNYQESSELKKLESNFNFLRNQINDNMSKNNEQETHNQNQKTSSFLDEIGRLKNDIKCLLKSQFKKEKPISEDGGVVSESPHTLSDKPSNNLYGDSKSTNQCLTVISSQSNLNDTNTMFQSKNASDSNFPVQTITKSQEVLSIKDVENPQKTVPMQVKTVPEIKIVKKRTRNLEDSDVIVVSSSTKLSYMTSGIWKPQRPL